MFVNLKYLDNRTVQSFKSTNKNFTSWLKFLIFFLDQFVKIFFLFVLNYYYFFFIHLKSISIINLIKVIF